jgi:hypothetical protein
VVAIPIIALILASLFLIVPSSPASLYVGVIGLGIAIFFAYLERTTLDPRITPAQRAQWDAALKDGQSVTINAEGIRTASPDLSMFVPWGSLRELRDDGEIVMFWRSPTFAIWLDQSVFTSSEERSALTAFAQAHLPSPKTPSRPEGDVWM